MGNYQSFHFVNIEELFISGFDCSLDDQLSDSLGCDSKQNGWHLNSIVLLLALLAYICCSGLMIRSALATMYQLGFRRQAGFRITTWKHHQLCIEH